MQGLGKPPGFKGKGQEGKGQEGKGQGKDFMTLRKPLPLWRVRGFPESFIPQITKYFSECIPIKFKFKHCLIREKIIQRGLITLVVVRLYGIPYISLIIY